MNKHETVQGHSRNPITDAAKYIAQGVGNEISNEYDITKIYTSDLPRAQQTAEALSIDAPLEKTWKLRELDFGNVVGKTLRHYHEENPKYSVKKSGVGALAEQYPGGESTRDVQSRILDFMDQLKSEHGEHETVVAVTHTTPLFCVIAESTQTALVAITGHHHIENCERLVVNIKNGSSELVKRMSPD